ncbi:unnamed protein product [Cyclocybe aegerita]|uniref:Uncharacterized protein n=1 Tax=Cyclocybe aegerita TaxID=1973307 RepID=A0A8S0WRV8_CYCAE|nr:unnamed protein product [Cyclocybe aegerita]
MSDNIDSSSLNLQQLLIPDTIFTPSVLAQRQSNELVVYSPTVSSTVTIAYPAHCNALIKAENVCRFLTNRDGFWECFCALISEHLVPTHIVVSHASGEVLVFCHYMGTAHEESHCGFYMNLTRKAKTARLFSNYNHIPTTASKQPALMTPIVKAFQAGHAGSNKIAPYFEGYLGELASDYPGNPGAHQLHSGLIMKPAKRRISSSKESCFIQW